MGSSFIDVLPAYAGMILEIEGGVLVTGSAPRVCGDDPDPWNRQHGARRVLPAYAGMIPMAFRGMALSQRAPRVCGDDPREDPPRAPASQCSPRMRG